MTDELAFRKLGDGPAPAGVIDALTLSAAMRMAFDRTHWRAYYAGLAMQGLCASTQRGANIDIIAEDAVGFANALLAALEGIGPKGDSPKYTDRDVHEFIDWLANDIPELRQVDVTKLAESWERFKRLL